MQLATRDRIVTAARQLFARQGYGATSVADILGAADVNAGSLYHFFPGKQDVLLAVLATYRSGIAPKLLAPLWKDVDDPIDRVFALLAWYRNALLTSDCAFGCPIGSLALEFHEPDGAVRELLAANFEHWVDAVACCFSDAGDRLPREIDRRRLATFALTTMQGGVMLARTHRSITHFDASVAMFRDYITRLEVEARA